eukprot:scpid56158/ scgid10875/ 
MGKRELYQQAPHQKQTIEMPNPYSRKMQAVHFAIKERNEKKLKNRYCNILKCLEWHCTRLMAWRHAAEEECQKTRTDSNLDRGISPRSRAGLEWEMGQRQDQTTGTLSMFWVELVFARSYGLIAQHAICLQGSCRVTYRPDTTSPVLQRRDETAGLSGGTFRQCCATVTWSLLCRKVPRRDGGALWRYFPAVLCHRHMVIAVLGDVRDWPEHTPRAEKHVGARRHIHQGEQTERKVGAHAALDVGASRCHDLLWHG